MLQKYSILAVDDEPFNLELIEAAFLSYDNVLITYAKDGHEALHKLEENSFDVVLLDISMPQISGLEVLKIIRSNEKYTYLPVLMVTANHEKEEEALHLGASDFITKPYNIKVLCSRTLNYAKLNQTTTQIKNQNEYLEQEVANRTVELQEALKLSKETEYEISTRLGRASESRDPETGGHIKRMSHYSKLLAELHGLSEDECELILYAAPLHDIGKIAIADNILLKPGRFEKEEFEIMKMHAQLGAQMLEGADRYPVIKAGHIIALQHHEKYDGTGYPNGKKGKDIHLYARIVTIADVFDALCSKRVYKEPMPLEKVLSIMKNDAGTHFDPQLVELFLNNIDKFLKIKEIFKDENTQPINETVIVQSQKISKILFVDDNELNRIVVKEMLALAFPNIQVDVHESPQDALDKGIQEYDVILTDINMPNINGYEFFDILRKEKNYRKPIIAITALAVNGDKEKILMYGFDDYISKPIDMNNFKQILKEYL